MLGLPIGWRTCRLLRGDVLRFTSPSCDWTEGSLHPERLDQARLEDFSLFRNTINIFRQRFSGMVSEVPNLWIEYLCLALVPESSF